VNSEVITCHKGTTVETLDIISQFPVHAELTPRERGVLGQLLRGLAVADIASELGIAPSTARMHIKRYTKRLRPQTSIRWRSGPSPMPSAA